MRIESQHEAVAGFSDPKTTARCTGCLLYTSKPGEARQFNPDRCHSLVILGVLALRDIPLDFIQGNFFYASFQESDFGSLGGTESNFSDYRGHGNHSDRQQGAPEEVIEETALAGFESSDDRDCDLILRHSCLLYTSRCV